MVNVFTNKKITSDYFIADYEAQDTLVIGNNNVQRKGNKALKPLFAERRADIYCL